jgi:hypothetical protein
MKAKKMKKLQLNKQQIAVLNNSEMSRVAGGESPTDFTGGGGCTTGCTDGIYCIIGTVFSQWNCTAAQ